MKTFFLPVTIAASSGKLHHTAARCEVRGPIIDLKIPECWETRVSSAEQLLLEVDRMRAPEVERKWTLESLGIVL